MKSPNCFAKKALSFAIKVACLASIGQSLSTYFSMVENVFPVLNSDPNPESKPQSITRFEFSQANSDALRLQAANLVQQNDGISQFENLVADIKLAMDECKIESPIISKPKRKT